MCNKMHNRLKELVLNTGLLSYMCIRFVTGFCGSENSGINVTSKSMKSVHVEWNTTKTNCGYNITGYRVYFESTSPFQTYKHKDVTGEKTNSTEIFPITPAFTYKIYVKALTSSGNEVSNPTSITYTHPHAKPDHAPTNIHASQIEPTSITIVWDALNKFLTYGDVKGYKIYYRGPGFTKTQNTFIQGETNRQLKVSGLHPNSTYQFVVAVVNDVGLGRFSSFIPIRTNPLPTTTTSTTTTTTTTPVPTTTRTTRITTKTTTSTTTTPSTSQTSTALSTQPSSTTTYITSTSTSTAVHASLTINTTSLGVHTTTVNKIEAEPEKETNNILMIVGIAAGVLILLAILIPLIVYMCRNCCLKGAVSPNQKKANNATNIPTKEAFTQVDLNFNRTIINYERRVSTDTLLSVDEYDEREVNETLSAKSKHRRFSKRALSYTDDSITEDAKSIQNMLQVNQSPPMRVESIVEVDELDTGSNRVPNEKHTSFSSPDVESMKTEEDSRSEQNFMATPEKAATLPKETTNVYVPYLDIQTKLFPPRKRKISPSIQPAFMYDSVTEENTFSSSHTRSTTSFSVKSRPAQTNPRVFVLESF